MSDVKNSKHENSKTVGLFLCFIIYNIYYGSNSLIKFPYYGNKKLVFSYNNNINY